MVLKSGLIVAMVCVGVNHISAEETWTVPVSEPAGAIVMRVAMVQDEEGDPSAAGKAAAEALKKAMDGVALKAVVISECFEDQENKEKLLAGVCSVVGPDMVFGGATYGSFVQSGCTDFDSVCLLGIGGEGIGVSAGLVTELGTAKLTVAEHQAEITERLHAAGKTLAEMLQRTELDKLLILIPDAHAPKNRYLLEGAQQVFGRQFPRHRRIGQQERRTDVCLLSRQVLSGQCRSVDALGQFPRVDGGPFGQGQGSCDSHGRGRRHRGMSKMSGKPLIVLAYNCAGRRGKLDDAAEELQAIQKAIGTTVPLFGCYNAGEIGPLDASEKDSDALCGGSGWHVMFTVLSR